MHSSGFDSFDSCDSCDGSCVQVQPRLDEYARLPARLGEVMPEYLRQENIYRSALYTCPYKQVVIHVSFTLVPPLHRVHVHIIPDEQHQYFKLVDQV